MKQVEELDKVFDRLFEEAEIAKFPPQELREYEASRMAYRDIKNSIDTAEKEGRIEANIETAQRLLAMGLPTEQVAKATQLPLDTVQNLSN
jgi:predicted transposase/invertase (TIGR01784 family)